jgi:hypothetical protein
MSMLPPIVSRLALVEMPGLRDAAAALSDIRP